MPDEPGSPIVFSSHSAGCADKPVLSGAQPISGWTLDAGNVYRADLAGGANAGRFPDGLNQLFRGGARLPFGRWPDLAGHPDGGYSEIDGHAANQITDTALPAGDLTCPHPHRGCGGDLCRRFRERRHVGVVERGTVTIH